MSQEELRLLEERLRQVPLEELNQITIHRMTGVEAMMTNRNRSGSKRWVTNGLDVIPLEELHDSNIMAKALSVKYNVNRHRILNYRKEHNIPRCKVRPNRRKNPMSVVPIDELNNGRITTYELAEKYKVCKKELSKYRREHNIKFIRPSGYSRPRRKK